MTATVKEQVNHFSGETRGWNHPEKIDVMSRLRHNKQLETKVKLTMILSLFRLTILISPLICKLVLDMSLVILAGWTLKLFLLVTQSLSHKVSTLT